jgi:hypothetical protein
MLNILLFLFFLLVGICVHFVDLADILRKDEEQLSPYKRIEDELSRLRETILCCIPNIEYQPLKKQQNEKKGGTIWRG